VKFMLDTDMCIYALKQERGVLGRLLSHARADVAISVITEAELRTGMGAHYRYAEHLSAVLREFIRQVPAAKDWVVEGTAEPE